jgi:hypothetical protein
MSIIMRHNILNPSRVHSLFLLKDSMATDIRSLPYSPFWDKTQAPCPPGSPEHRRYVTAFRDGIARGSFGTRDIQWFYHEFHDLVLPPPISPPKTLEYFYSFFENHLIPWLPPRTDATRNPQDMTERLRAAFGQYYTPHSRYVTYARETDAVVGRFADTLTLLIDTGRIRKTDAQKIVRHFPMLGWDDVRCTGRESVHELADVIAFYLGPKYGGSLKLPSIVAALNQKFQGSGIPPLKL